MSEAMQTLASVLKAPLKDAASHKAESIVTAAAVTTAAVNPLGVDTFALTPSSITMYLSAIWLTFKIVRDGYATYIMWKDQQKPNKENKKK